MSLENNIKNVIQQKLDDGTVEKLVAEHLEKGVTAALENLFRSYGDVTKVIESKVKEVMVPYLESYDYSDYIVKLDHVLTEVLKNSALENKRLLENFKELMITPEEKVIKVTDLFEEWKKHVAKEIETDGLEIDYDDGPTYEMVEVTMNVEEEDGRSWSSFEYATVFFECEHDEKMNFEFKISRWKESRNKNWDLRYDKTPELNSLRHLNDFELLLMKLTQNHVNVELDSHYEEDEVEPDEKPEASFY